MEKIIKISLAVLLLLCVADMPYGFYQLVRFGALIGFGILASAAHQKEQNTQVIIYVALAVLFQPIIKISLGRTLWNVVDVVVAIGLLISMSEAAKNER